MVTVRCPGDFKKTVGYLEKVREIVGLGDLDKYGRAGVEALKAATPVDSGKTADSWDYEIVHRGNTTSIYWTNSNINNGVNIAIILQYGHGTGWGGYVQGRDYINPAIRDTFDRLTEDICKEVANA